MSLYFLEYHAMFLENCVIHYILSMDMKAAKEFTWKNLWQLYLQFLDMAWVIECFRIDFTF